MSVESLLIAATALVPPLLLLPEGNVLRQALIVLYLMVVPGLSVALRVSAPGSPIFCAETLVLVVPLSFGLGVLGSTFLIYTGLWSPFGLLVVTGLGVTASSLLRIRQHLGIWPTRLPNVAGSIRKARR